MGAFAIPPVDLAQVVALVCRRVFPRHDPGEFVGYVWEQLGRRKPAPAKLLRFVRSAMIDWYRTAAGRGQRPASYGRVPEGAAPQRCDGEYEAEWLRRAVVKARRRLARDRATVVGVAVLATDPSFDPGDYIARPDTKPRHLMRSTCRGCGVRYAPGYVCGYCRAKVVSLRGRFK